MSADRDESDEPAAAPTAWRIAAADAGQRLQHILARRLSLSLRQVNRLLDSGLVTVDGRLATLKNKGSKVEQGQSIIVQPFDRPADEHVLPQADLPLDILTQDDSAGWLAINKPAGMPVHPLDAGETGTVLNALISRVPGLHGVGEGGLRSGVVHRLDVDTSGTLLLATKQETWQRLREAFRRHETTKLYHAIALGRWSLADEGECRLPLVVAQHKPAKVRVAADDYISDSSVRLCDTRWRVLEQFRGATLLEISLGTGFLHQIRATLAHLGHPLAGDRHYSRPGVIDRSGAARPMLHARRLAVAEIDVGCEPPEDFQRCIETCDMNL